MVAWIVLTILGTSNRHDSQ